MYVLINISIFYGISMTYLEILNYNEVISLELVDVMWHCGWCHVILYYSRYGDGMHRLGCNGLVDKSRLMPGWFISTFRSSITHVLLEMNTVVECLLWSPGDGWGCRWLQGVSSAGITRVSWALMGGDWKCMSSGRSLSEVRIENVKLNFLC